MKIMKFFGDSVNFVGVIDNNKDKSVTQFCGLPVFLPNEIVNESFNGKIIVPIRNNSEVVIDQLIGLGVCEDNIINFSEMITELENSQYFSLSELPHDNNEVFCDVGCFDDRVKLILIFSVLNLIQKILIMSD